MLPWLAMKGSDPSVGVRRLGVGDGVFLSCGCTESHGTRLAEVQQRGGTWTIRVCLLLLRCSSSHFSLQQFQFHLLCGLNHCAVTGSPNFAAAACPGPAVMRGPGRCMEPRPMRSRPPTCTSCSDQPDPSWPPHTAKGPTSTGGAVPAAARRLPRSGIDLGRTTGLSACLLRSVEVVRIRRALLDHHSI